MNFVSLIFTDTHDLAGSLRTRAGLFSGADEHGARQLWVREIRPGTEADAESFRWTPAVLKKKWPEMQAMLARISREGERLMGAPIELGLVWLEMLDRGAVTPWHNEVGGYIERHTRLHLALRTNPGAMLFCGTESFHALPGQVVAINPRVAHSAVNLGEWPRVHLICDVRKKETDI